eukprot:4610143-Prorocentrum_lima.AAC.1
MTSSLVGSEMCIRDRWRTSGATMTAWRTSSAGALTISSTSRILRSFFEPVSYTHLTLPTICSV